MFFYKVLTPISTTPVYTVPAIHVNTSKSMYTFTSVYMPQNSNFFDKLSLHDIIKKLIQFLEYSWNHEYFGSLAKLT